MKKTLVLLGLALAVMLGFCGCGNEKSEETGIEIKKISEEEVYELLARVEEKAKKIEDARLSMDQGFQEKWDLLKRKQTAADRAFSKNDYNATSKFLQEAEAAADWIMNRGPLRAEADEQYCKAGNANPTELMLRNMPPQFMRKRKNTNSRDGKHTKKSNLRKQPVCMCLQQTNTKKPLPPPRHFMRQCMK